VASKKASKENKYVGKGWGRRKYWTEPASDEVDKIFKFRCDKLCQEIDEKLRASVKIYTSKTHSQEFLRTLVSGN
jgi:hypothetical protein